MGRGEGKGGQRLVTSEQGVGRTAFSLTKDGKISMEEVRKHKTPKDAWLVYRNRVYDVSDWKEHPGGNVIFTHAGDDCTDIFAAFHPPGLQADLDRFYIGELDVTTEKKSNAQRDFEKAYRDLRGKLVTMGFFNASFLYYVWKITQNLMLVGSAWALLAYFGSYVAARMLSATCLALFWQQCGWLAHDFLHHQVFKNRAYGDIAGIFIGNIAQGFSVAWWKNKHNTHHAVPNLVESSPDAHDGDPDIDTMPILAWSLSMAAKSQDSKLGRFFVRHQAMMYFPILLIARVSWLLQSFLFVFDKVPGADLWATKGAEDERQVLKNKGLEKLGLLLYYLWYGTLMFRYLTPFQAICYFASSQMICGLFLALVFGLGHNGMAVYDADARPDFWKLQVTTTRNVKGGALVQWFCGGLGYQVDHHLFPMIPRHKLADLHGLVESFCKEHNVRYHETNMWDGTVEVLSHLSEVTTLLPAGVPRHVNIVIICQDDQAEDYHPSPLLPCDHHHCCGG